MAFHSFRTDKIYDANFDAGNPIKTERFRDFAYCKGFSGGVKTFFWPWPVGMTVHEICNYIHESNCKYKTYWINNPIIDNAFQAAGIKEYNNDPIQEVLVKKVVSSFLFEDIDGNIGEVRQFFNNFNVANSIDKKILSEKDILYVENLGVF